SARRNKTPTELLLFTFGFSLLTCILPLNPGAEPAHDLPRHRANRRGHFARGYFFVALSPDEHDLIAGRDVEPGDVHHDHVHADRSDNGHPTAADECRSAIRQSRV